MVWLVPSSSNKHFDSEEFLISHTQQLSSHTGAVLTQSVLLRRLGTTKYWFYRFIIINNILLIFCMFISIIKTFVIDPFSISLETNQNCKKSIPGMLKRLNAIFPISSIFCKCSNAIPTVEK